MAVVECDLYGGPASPLQTRVLGEIADAVEREISGMDTSRQLYSKRDETPEADSRGDGNRSHPGRPRSAKRAASPAHDPSAHDPQWWVRRYGKTSPYAATPVARVGPDVRDATHGLARDAVVAQDRRQPVATAARAARRVSGRKLVGVARRLLGWYGTKG